MTKKRKKASKKQDCYTESIDVTFGSFSLSTQRVPFMTAVLSFQQVSDYLNLVTDNPKYANQDWSIDELFQRDVDFNRVIEISSQYLDPALDRPKFFNSLTVVLSPDDEHYKAFECAPKPENVDYEHYTEFGPILIGYDDADDKSPLSGSFGVLRWNKLQVNAVAIDGQHRLSAIKHFLEHQQNKQAAKECYISVIFLLIDEKFGFVTRYNNDPLTLMRKIFIDLNKHAVPVSKARNILLDDTDPTSLFVRSLIGRQLQYTPTNDTWNGWKIGKNDEFYKCIPLELIDWHSEAKSKVDEGPYITSILGLEWIVTKLLKSKTQLKYIPSMFDPDDEDVLKKIRKKLSTWKKTWKEHFEDHVSKCEQNDYSFVLTSDELASLKKEFELTWGPAITRCLTCLHPYKELIDYRIRKDTLNPQFGQWYQAKSLCEVNEKRSQRAYNEYAEKLEEIEKELKVKKVPIGNFKTLTKEIKEKFKKDSIFYYLVGQRALFLSLIDLARRQKAVNWANRIGVDYSTFEYCPNDFYAFYLITAINKYYKRGSGELFDKGFTVNRSRSQGNSLYEYSKCFWAASLVKRDDPNNMDFSESGAKRGKEFITLLAHTYWFTKINNVKKTDLINDLINPSKIHDMPLGTDLLDSYRLVVGTDSTYYDSPMGFYSGLLSSQWDEVVAKAAAKERMLSILQCLGIE